MYFIVILLSFVFPVAITFQVDMQEQFVSDNGIHLAGADTLTLSTFGTYQDSVLAPWTPEQLTMEDIDFDGVCDQIDNCPFDPSIISEIFKSY